MNENKLPTHGQRKENLPLMQAVLTKFRHGAEIYSNGCN